MQNKILFSRNAIIGLWLFAFYATVYLAFVLVNAFAASVMERVYFAGLNLAILWGFGLIFLAVVMALVYGWLCNQDSSSGDQE